MKVILDETVVVSYPTTVAYITVEATENVGRDSFASGNKTDELNNVKTMFTYSSVMFSC